VKCLGASLGDELVGVGPLTVKSLGALMGDELSLVPHWAYYLHHLRKVYQEGSL
jgi:hypothetical protein